MSLQGKFTIAAKHHISIAEIYESEIVDIDKVRLNAFKFLICLHSVVTWNLLSNCRLLYIMSKLPIITKEKNQTGV